MVRWYEKAHLDGTEYTNEELTHRVREATRRYLHDDPDRSLLSLAAIRAVAEWMDEQQLVVVETGGKPLYEIDTTAAVHPKRLDRALRMLRDNGVLVEVKGDTR